MASGGVGGWPHGQPSCLSGAAALIIGGLTKDSAIENDPALASARSLHLLRGEERAIPAGLFCMASALVGVWWLFAPLVDQKLLGIWLGYMAAVLIALLVTYLVARVRRPSPQVYLAIFGPIGRWLNFALTVGTAASVWILMPAAGDAGRMFLVVIYMWFVMVQVMVHGEGLRVLTTTVIFGVLGSLVLYMLVNPMPYSVAIAVFLALVALTMAALQSEFRSAMREAIAARVESEAMTRARDEALAAVIVERDRKTRFLESASHDLRQPLQAARMFLDQAEQHPPGARRDTAIDRLHRSLDATDRSLTQILEYLKLDAGEVRANPRSFPIGPVLANIVDVNEALASQTGVRLHAMASRLRVRADPDLVERAIGNLVTNALRHAQGSRISLSARHRSGVVRVWVIDNGKGTVAEDRAALFDDYFQGSDRGDTQRGGFGLGLASVRRLAALMGGAVGLDERWIKGSAFWLELPAADR